MSHVIPWIPYVHALFNVLHRLTLGRPSSPILDKPSPIVKDAPVQIGQVSSVDVVTISYIQKRRE